MQTINGVLHFACVCIDRLIRSFRSMWGQGAIVQGFWLFFLVLICDVKMGNPFPKTLTSLLMDFIKNMLRTTAKLVITVY